MMPPHRSDEHRKQGLGLVPALCSLQVGPHVCLLADSHLSDPCAARPHLADIEGFQEPRRRPDNIGLRACNGCFPTQSWKGR